MGCRVMRLGCACSTSTARRSAGPERWFPRGQRDETEVQEFDPALDAQTGGARERAWLDDLDHQIGEPLSQPVKQVHNE